MKLFFNILLTFIFLASSLWGQKEQPVKIGSVEFYGNSAIGSSQLNEWFGLKKGATFDRDNLNQYAQKLLSACAENGYPFTRIDSLVYRIDNNHQADIAVYLTEGKRISLGEIGFTGVDSTRAEQIRMRFDSRPGQRPDIAVLERDLDDALSQFEIKGYPFARFDLASVHLDSLDDQSLSIGLNFKTAIGPQLILQEIQIVGNDLTRENVILREIGIKPGEIFSKNKVDQIPARLMRTGYFEYVNEPQVYLADKNEGGLLIRLKEGNASKFDGVIGYNPGSGDQPGYFTGLIDVSLGNLLGTGRSLLAHWQKRDAKTQDLKFHYREPWVAGFPVHVGMGFQQLIQDTTYIQRDLALDVAMPLFENFTLHSEFARTEIIPDSLGSYLFLIPKSRSLSASIGLSYDTRDDLLNPLSGLFYQTTIQSGRKNNRGPEDLIESLALKKQVDNKRITLDIEYYGQFFRRQVVALALHGRQIRSNEAIIPLSDQFRLGGARTLRGYSEDQFRGSNVGWMNLEYRYILGRRSRVFLFTDAGYFYSKTLSGVTEGTKLGYGLGFRLETGLGIMGIDYGLGEGDGLFNGKVHVGLVNEF